MLQTYICFLSIFDSVSGVLISHRNRNTLILLEYCSSNPKNKSNGYDTKKLSPIFTNLLLFQHFLIGCFIRCHRLKRSYQIFWNYQLPIPIQKHSSCSVLLKGKLLSSIRWFCAASTLRRVGNLLVFLICKPLFKNSGDIKWRKYNKLTIYGQTKLSPEKYDKFPIKNLYKLLQ